MVVGLEVSIHKSGIRAVTGDYQNTIYHRVFDAAGYGDRTLSL